MSGEAVADARAKFACPACGGEAVWNPARQALVCPFCGTVSPARIDDAGAIVEHDLAAALRALPDSARGFLPDARQVRCQSCNAISVLDASRQAQNCPFCGSAQLVPYTETKPAFRPESVLPFRIAETAARDAIRRWYGRLWLAPSALKKRALTDTVRGVYLPYWTFDAHVEADWTAEAGHYYYESETVFVNGQPRVRHVQKV
ncbi:MAG TPA: zinc ribbon domain-containing protein, partial [Casimicrobiaceae bacterium]